MGSASPPAKRTASLKSALHAMAYDEGLTFTAYKVQYEKRLSDAQWKAVGKWLERDDAPATYVAVHQRTTMPTVRALARVLKRRRTLKSYIHTDSCISHSGFKEIVDAARANEGLVGFVLSGPCDADGWQRLCRLMAEHKTLQVVRFGHSWWTARAGICAAIYRSDSLVAIDSAFSDAEAKDGLFLRNVRLARETNERFSGLPVDVVMRVASFCLETAEGRALAEKVREEW